MVVIRSSSGRGLAAVAAVLALTFAAGQEPADATGDEPARIGEQIDRLVARLTDPHEPDAVLKEGFELFVARMDAFDGAGALELARALHGRSPAVWSAFVLEGALRRSASADPRAEASVAAYEEGDAALRSLISDPSTSVPDRIASIQRRAILAAGFARPRAERAALGAALAGRGTDGAQILGLAALTAGEHETAAALFASLLDAPAPGPDGAPAERPPWALRGHSLAVLEQLISRN